MEFLLGFKAVEIWRLSALIENVQIRNFRDFAAAENRRPCESESLRFGVRRAVKAMLTYLNLQH